MIQASNFGGKRICATKMSIAYKDVQMAGSNGQCNNDFIACSANGKISAANIICIPKSKQSEGCPITSLQLIKSSDLKSSNYQYVDFTDGYKLGFSKSVDSLPVTDLLVQLN